MGRRKHSIAGLLCGAACLCAAPAFASGPSYIPGSDTAVLETLPAQRDPAVRDLHAMRARLAAAPGDPALAAAYARRAIEIGRALGDPRYHGYASSALARWTDPAQTPTEIAWLQAVLQQQRHEFDGALSALDALIARGDYAPARLTRAALLTVQGRPQDALRDCAALARSNLIAATVCGANVGSLSGRGQGALQAIDSIQPRLESSTEEQLWALTLAAEIAARLERSDAQARFDQALAVMDQAGQRDPYLLAAYADFELDRRQPQSVIERLRGLERIDNLLLRLALAEQLLDLPLAATHRVELQARFAAVRARKETTHGREETLFTLRMSKDPKAALVLAQANWGVQREPFDARLLLESAIAAKDTAAAAPVRDWMRRTGIEDPLLHRLAAQLEPRP